MKKTGKTQIKILEFCQKYTEKLVSINKEYIIMKIMRLKLDKEKVALVNKSLNEIKSDNKGKYLL